MYGSRESWTNSGALTLPMRALTAAQFVSACLIAMMMLSSMLLR